MPFRTKLAGPAPRCALYLAGPARAVGLASLAGVLMIATPLAAQSVDGDNAAFAGSGLLSTSIVYGRKWTASASLNTLADSNFRRTNEPESAIRITPAIDVGVGLPIGRQQLFLGGDFGRDFIIGKSEFNTNRSSIGGGMAWRVGARCSGMVGAEYRSRLNQVFEQAQFTPNVQNTTVYAGSANCQTATGFGFGGSIRRQNIDNERPERAQFDLRSTVFAPNISYGSATIGQISLGATINNTTYPSRFTPTLDGLVGDGVKIFSGRIGYTREFGPRMTVSVGASYLKSSPRPRTTLVVDANGQVFEVQRDDFKGSGYDISVKYRPSSRLSVNISGSRDVNVSPNVGALFIVSQGLDANISYTLSSRLVFGLGGSRIKNDYKESFTSPDEPLRRISDRINRVYAQLDYTPVPLYSVGIVVGHQWRKSNPDDFDFKSTTARLRLRVKFGRV